METENLKQENSDLFHTSDSSQKAAPLLNRGSILIIVCGILILTMINYTLAKPKFNLPVTDLQGRVTSLAQVKKSVIMTLCMGVPLLGFIIGLLTSLIPYKGVAYPKKYLIFSLITMLGIHILLVLIQAINIFSS